MSANWRKRSFNLLVILLLAVALIAPAVECTEALPTEDKTASTIPEPLSKEMDMLARVTDSTKLDRLYLNSAAAGDNTVSKLVDKLKAEGLTKVKIKGEGIVCVAASRIPLPTYILNRIARYIWTGKIMTFVLKEDGSMGATLDNAILGQEVISADVYVATLQESQAIRKEPILNDGDYMRPVLIPFERPVKVDAKKDLVLDYGTSGFRVAHGIIDLLRPVTMETLEEAGIDIPDGVGDINDMWIGRSTVASGWRLRKRSFIVYFAVQFNQDTAEYS